MSQICEFRSDIWGPLPHEIWRPKSIKFPHNFGQLSNLIVNVSRTQQDIISRKTVLQTMDNPAQADLIQFTLFHKWQKDRTRVLTHLPAIVQRTGVNKSVAFARGQHGEAITLFIATHLVFTLFSVLKLVMYGAVFLSCNWHVFFSLHFWLFVWMSCSLLCVCPTKLVVSSVYST